MTVEYRPYRTREEASSILGRIVTTGYLSFRVTHISLNNNGEYCFNGLCATKLLERWHFADDGACCGIKQEEE